mgnify:CR=1 FL=1
MKKLAALALIAMLGFVLVGCGESTNDLNDPDHVLNQDRG